MNILFLSLSNFDSITQRGIYPDLLRKFSENGHSVYVISPLEKRLNRDTEIIQDDKATILRLKIGNIRGVHSKIEKGLSTIMLGTLFKRAVKKYFSNIKFDLILFVTPPISLLKPVKYVKKRDGAFCYLMLKDIFPQNSVDIGILSKSGIKGIIYKYFRKKEKAFYAVSDYIGCMSQANVDYVVKHNVEVLPDRVGICPNCIEVLDLSLSDVAKTEMRKKYGLPEDKKIFVYGGNLGKPQGIPFIIDCLRSCKNKDVFFLIVGDGTEYNKLESFIKTENQNNVKLMKRLPKEDYDRMVASCDVGLIFLDHRFTIPNFPSRLLSYMQVGIPVLACTDANTDIGKVIVDGGFGWWCESNSTADFESAIEKAANSDSLAFIGQKGLEYLKQHYTSDNAYCKIMNKINE